VVVCPAPAFSEATDSPEANNNSADGGPTNPKSLLKEHPPGPGSASRTSKRATLKALYEPVILLSNKWCFSREVLLNCDYFIKECYRDFPKSSLQYLAKAAIKKNKKKAVKTSRKESLFVTHPACIAGVFSTLPNFKAMCGRTKL